MKLSIIELERDLLQQYFLNVVITSKGMSVYLESEVPGSGKASHNGGHSANDRTSSCQACLGLITLAPVYSC